MNYLRHCTLAITCLLVLAVLAPFSAAQALLTQLQVSPQQVVGGSTQTYGVTISFTVAPHDPCFPDCNEILITTGIPNTQPFSAPVQDYAPGAYTETYTFTAQPVSSATTLTITAYTTCPNCGVINSISGGPITVVPMTESVSLDKMHIVGTNWDNGNKAVLSHSFSAPPLPCSQSFTTGSPPGLLSFDNFTEDTVLVYPIAEVQQSTPVTITDGLNLCSASGNVTVSANIVLYVEPRFPNVASETDLGPPCPGCGSPISLAAGNTYIEQNDIRIPGLGGGLVLTRMWNSMWPASQSGAAAGLVGNGWRSTYEERVFTGSDGTVKYSRSDGNFWSFLLGQSGTYQLVAPANGGATLTAGNNYWTVTYKNGERRLFSNTSGSLIAIVDRNGNQTQLAYDGQNRLTTITDPASRHLSFIYPNGNSYLVTGVTLDVGLSFSYSYDGQGRLALVTRPDQSTLSFEYNDPNPQLITAVKDSNGKVIEAHTYDSQSRGLTSTRAGGVDAVTLSYPQ